MENLLKLLENTFNLNDNNKLLINNILEKINLNELGVFFPFMRSKQFPLKKLNGRRRYPVSPSSEISSEEKKPSCIWPSITYEAAEVITASCRRKLSNVSLFSNLFIKSLTLVSSKASINPPEYI